MRESQVIKTHINMHSSATHSHALNFKSPPRLALSRVPINLHRLELTGLYRYLVFFTKTLVYDFLFLIKRLLIVCGFKNRFLIFGLWFKISEVDFRF